MLQSRRWRKRRLLYRWLLEPVITLTLGPLVEDVKAVHSIEHVALMLIPGGNGTLMIALEVEF